jgi:FKBP-type peptidyl-prolyl cis-trans isomerase FklB
MKSIACIALLVLAAHGSARADDDKAPEGKKERGSWAFGYDMGQSFRTRGVEVDPEQLLKGLKAALADEKLPMSEKDFQKALAGFQGELRTKGEKYRRRSYAENVEAGKAFQAQYQKKDGVVTLPSGLQYRVLQEGKGTVPGNAETVTAQYRGTLVDGAPFETAGAGGTPASMKLSSLVPGLREAMRMMPVGSRWQVVVPPQLAYGEKGGGPGVGPGATVIYDVELVSVP